MRACMLPAVTAAVCSVCLAATGAEPDASIWHVEIDLDSPLGPVSPVFAGANVNRAGAMLLGRPGGRSYRV